MTDMPAQPVAPAVPPVAADFEAALEATWPAAAWRRLGPWVLRDGAGGGQRVSAATAEGPVAPAALEEGLVAMGPQPLVRVRPALCAWDGALDRGLADRGFVLSDPTLILAARAVEVAPEPLPPLLAFSVWPPLAAQRDIWAKGGIGPARQAIMARVQGPRAALMARRSDRVAGTAFVALHGAVAMLHAVEVPATLRRRGAARALTQAAARWAIAQGATWLALTVTEANGPARTLYDALGMTPVHRYHYRRAPAAAAS
ncbi:MAG: GNAT family N-acetyltransferase [Alkalilacustris sp.]